MTTVWFSTDWPPATAALVGTLLGAIIGSFIATVALRWPKGDAVVTGRSRCDGCGQPLRPWELIPLVSWLALRGRCRRCGARIAPTHVMVELASAAIGGAAQWLAPGIGGLALALLGWQLLLLGWLDARHFWLPHVLSVTLALTGVVCGGVAGAAVGLPIPLIDRMIGAMAGFSCLFIIAAAYRQLRGRDGLGGGDAPMFGAIGAWTGWALLPIILLLAAFAGIAAALAAHGRGDRNLATRQLPLGTLMALATPVAIAVATRLLA